MTPPQDLSREPSSPLHLLLIAAAIVVGVLWRVEGLGEMPLYGDEYHTLRTVDESYGFILSNYDEVGSHMALPFLQRAIGDVIGRGMWAMRLPGLVPGILTLLLLFPLGRRLVGATPAALATIALCFSPIHIFYSRFGRSYALAALIALLLVHCVLRALESKHGSALRRWAPVTLLGALLPYVHLSSLGVTFLVGLAAMGLAFARERRVADLRAPVVAFALSAVLCGLLFLPAQETLAFYLGKIKAGRMKFGLMDVPTLLGGGITAGWIWLVAIPVAALGLTLKQASRGLLMTGAIAGPLAFMMIFQPQGMAYAYARYVHVALPFMLLLLGWLVTSLVRGFGPARPGRDKLALVAGSALVLLGHFTGPLRPGLPDPGPYGNTYTAMRPLPAFDEPFSEMPAFYRQLAADPSVERIIECPVIQSRAILLYRNYFLKHGKQTVFALFDKNETLQAGPYVRLWDKDIKSKSGGATYLILHKNVAEEVGRYWAFVYNQAWDSQSNAGFMARHNVYLPPPDDLSLFIPRLRRFGEPVYEDAMINVYRVPEDKVVDPDR